MNTDHWLWAFGQPITGTEFPSFIIAPNDPTVIPYPGCPTVTRLVVFRPLTGPSAEAELIAVWRRDNPSALMRRFQEEIVAMSTEIRTHKP